MVLWFPNRYHKKEMRSKEGFLIVVLFWTVLGRVVGVRLDLLRLHMLGVELQHLGALVVDPDHRVLAPGAGDLAAPHARLDDGGAV